MNVYTLDQVEAFLAAAERNRKADMITDAIATRQATLADGKGFGNFIESVVGRSEPKVIKATKADLGQLAGLLGMKKGAKHGL